MQPPPGGEFIPCTLQTKQQRQKPLDTHPHGHCYAFLRRKPRLLSFSSDKSLHIVCTDRDGGAETRSAAVVCPRPSASVRPIPTGRWRRASPLESIRQIGRPQTARASNRGGKCSAVFPPSIYCESSGHITNHDETMMKEKHSLHNTLNCP